MAPYVPRVRSRKRQPTTGNIISNRVYGAGGVRRGFGLAPPRVGTGFTPTPSSAASIGGSSAPAPPAAADPRDPQYFNDIAKLDQYYATSKADLTAAGEAAARQLARNNLSLAEQQPKDTLVAKQGANNAGLFYSGALGKNLGEIEKSYARRRSELAENFQTSEAGRLRQLKDLEVNYGPVGPGTGLMRNDVLLGGVGRAAQRDQDLGVPGPPEAAAPVAAPAAGGRQTKVAVSAKLGGRWVYEKRGNSWVPIRRTF